MHSKFIGVFKKILPFDLIRHEGSFFLEHILVVELPEINIYDIRIAKCSLTEE